ncbi:DUF4258 domain-containing protein [Legionella sp. PATHC035]|uniref:DUF4258 domain-containing protein n=1 Tax=Legionella sp. PATHC035 TaxID=2992040 RepID=UPI0022448502|nr:DUF4258 domain-containing protein [Legionella sp. PATHC035]MCW8409784.1 DUF4258 domain-containing protein [Legionella sp. PATHC035]
MKSGKPLKKADKELFILIERKIKEKNYLFTTHAKKRGQERNISDLDVLNILEGKPGYERKRNKKKDSYDELQDLNDQPQDWKYCIEGKDIDGKKVRIIISFTEDLMPIITVINIR